MFNRIKFEVIDLKSLTEMYVPGNQTKIDERKVLHVVFSQGFLY